MDLIFQPPSPPAEDVGDQSDENLPPTPNVEATRNGSKRRRKKLVDKTFVDDSGFMVTKKELVSCSEEEPSPQPSPVKKPPVQEKETKASSSKPMSKKQSNIKNFFKKM